MWIVRFFNWKLIFVSFKLDIHKLRYCHFSEPINFLLGPVQWNQSARYPYLNCIDGIEQQPKKISVKWINRLKQWDLVVQALPKIIILGMFKSEGLEESSKYGCLTTSALIYLRSECVLLMGFEPWLSYQWRKWSTLFLPLITQRTITFSSDHGVIPFKNLRKHRKIPEV